MRPGTRTGHTVRQFLSLARISPPLSAAMGIDDLFGAAPHRNAAPSSSPRSSGRVRKYERRKSSGKKRQAPILWKEQQLFDEPRLVEDFSRKRKAEPKKPTAAQVEALEARLKKRIITVDMDGTAYDPWACCGKADMSHVGTDKCRHMRQDVIDEVRALAQKTNASVVVLSWRGGDKGTRKWLEHVGFEVDAVFIPESEDDIVGYAPEVKGSKKKPIGAQAGFKLSTLQSLRALGHNVIASFRRPSPHLRRVTEVRRAERTASRPYRTSKALRIYSRMDRSTRAVGIRFATRRNRPWAALTAQNAFRFRPTSTLQANSLHTQPLPSAKRRRNP